MLLETNNIRCSTITPNYINSINCTLIWKSVEHKICCFALYLFAVFLILIIYIYGSIKITVYYTFYLFICSIICNEITVAIYCQKHVLLIIEPYQQYLVLSVVCYYLYLLSIPYFVLMYIIRGFFFPNTIKWLCIVYIYLLVNKAMQITFCCYLNE